MLLRRPDGASLVQPFVWREPCRPIVTLHIFNLKMLLAYGTPSTQISWSMSSHSKAIRRVVGSQSRARPQGDREAAQPLRLQQWVRSVAFVSAALAGTTPVRMQMCA